jgi:hypothetical protein
MKGQRRMAKADLDKLFNELLDINNRITKLEVFPSLGWVWCFDILRDIFENSDTGYDETIAEGVTLQQIFNKFFEDINTLGLDMDMGGEILVDTIRDWMRENNFLVALDDDGWLDNV